MIDVSIIVFVNGVEIEGSYLNCGTSSKGALTALIWKTYVSQVTPHKIIGKLATDLVAESSCTNAKTEGMRTVFYAFSDFLHGVQNYLTKLAITANDQAVQNSKSTLHKVPPTVLVLYANLLETKECFG